MKIRDIKDEKIRELKLEQGLKEVKSQLIDAGYRKDSLLILSITNLLEV